MTMRAAIACLALSGLLLGACETTQKAAHAVGLAPTPTPCQDATVTLYFEANIDQLTPAGLEIVRYTAKRMKACPIAELSLLGLADANGNPVDNLDLSKRRAEHVRDAFLAAGLPVHAFTLRAAGSIGAETASGAQVPVRRRVDVTVVIAKTQPPPKA